MKANLLRLPNSMICIGMARKGVLEESYLRVWKLWVDKALNENTNYVLHRTEYL